MTTPSQTREEGERPCIGFLKNPSSKRGERQDGKELFVGRKRRERR